MAKNPVTGQDADVHSSSTSSGMVLARKVRAKYIQSMISGDMQFANVVEFSKSKTSSDAKYLSKLRLYDVLRAKEGWNGPSALEALERNGFTKTDNLQSIRRTDRKVQLFSQIFEGSRNRWDARPEVPPNWPWMGKLSALIEDSGEPLPPELGGETIETEPMIDDSDLDELFGDPAEVSDTDIDRLLS